MSRKGRQLERAIDHVLQATKKIRNVLTRYDKANRRLVMLIGDGVPIMEVLAHIGAQPAGEKSDN